ncbi:MAG: DUF2079 domain-containing protein, partial [Chloroflexota bacterium]|nr:DUF2079 domain-containing protein [Chloroflexota bacterium]
LLGLWTIIFQRQWRIGLVLIALPLVWLGLWQVAVHFYSPTGKPLLQTRYTYLGKGPVEIAKTVLLHPGMIIKGHILEKDHIFYLRLLLTPAGYLPLLAPWVLVLAAPSLLLNLLSSDANQYSGMFQYNAEIVPILIFSTIEAIVLIVWVAQWVITRFNAWREKSKGNATFSVRMPGVYRWVHIGLVLVLIAYALFNTMRADATTSIVPFGSGFSWPQETAHTRLATSFIRMIPADASVSAQSALAPHISHRTHIYLFPYGADGHADYVFLDVTGDIYPSFDTFYYTNQVKKVLFSGQYGIVAAQDGYLLLKRGLPAPGVSPSSPVQHGDINTMLPNLPDSFCSFARVSGKGIAHPLQVTFANPDNNDNTMDLVGYNIAAPNPFSIASSYQQITTYWSVTAPTKIPWTGISFYTDKTNTEHFISVNVPAFSWCPTTSWKPGTIMQMQSWVERIGNAAPGVVHLSIAVLPLLYPYSKIMDVQARLSLHILSAPGNVIATGTNGLQLATLTLVH